MRPLILHTTTNSYVGVALRGHLPDIVPSLTRATVVRNLTGHSHGSNRNSAAFGGGLLHPSDRINLRTRLLTCSVAGSSNAGINTGPVRAIPPEINDANTCPAHACRCCTKRLRHRNGPVARLNHDISGVGTATIRFNKLGFAPTSIVGRPRGNLNKTVDVLPVNTA